MIEVVRFTLICLGILSPQLMCARTHKPLGAASSFWQFSNMWVGFYNPEPANYRTSEKLIPLITIGAFA